MKKLFLLLLIPVIFGCAKQIHRINDPKQVNLVSANYFMFGETAIQQGDYQSAIELFLQADKAAPNNVYIKEKLMEILAFQAMFDKKYETELITLGEKYYKQNLYSANMLLFLANSQWNTRNLTKAEKYYKEAVRLQPEMNNLLSYYNFLKTENSIQDTTLLNQARNLPWKNQQGVLQMALFYKDVDTKMEYSILKKAHSTWDSEDTLLELIRYLDEHKNIDEILEIVKNRLVENKPVSDQLMTYYIGRLFEHLFLNEVILNAERCIEIGSSTILQYLFLSAAIDKNIEVGIQAALHLSDKLTDEFKPTFYGSYAALLFTNDQIEEAIITLGKADDIYSLERFISFFEVEDEKDKLESFLINFINAAHDKNMANYLSTLYFSRIEEDENAIKSLEKISDEFLEENNLHLFAATVYLTNSTDIFKARTLLQKAQEIPIPLNEIISNILYRVGKEEAALQILMEEINTAEKPTANSFVIFSSLAEKYLLIDDIVAILEKGVALYPEDADLLNGLAYLITDNDISQKYELAEKLLIKATELKPESVMIWDSYAWLLFKTKRYKDALIAMEIPIKENIKHSEITYHLGKIFLKLNMMEEAEKYFLLTVEINNEEDSVKNSKELIEKYFSGKKRGVE